MPQIKRSKKSIAGRRRAPAVQFLGEVFTEIAGMQYYDGGVSPGDRVQLEREPENEHDRNAIRIENKSFHQAGYVPRRISSWLAPLIDSGEVWAEGRVAESSKAHESDRVFILIHLYLHEKGRRILERDADPKNISEGLHQALLAIWFETDRWTDGDAVSALATRLNALVAEDLLPKTHMLLALFKHRAWILRRRAHERAIEDVRDSMKEIKTGKALFHHNLTVFPLLSKKARTPDYLLLKEAIEKTAVTGNPKKLAEERKLIADYCANVKGFKGLQFDWDMKDGIPTNKPTFIFSIQDGKKILVKEVRP